MRARFRSLQEDMRELAHSTDFGDGNYEHSSTSSEHTSKQDTGIHHETGPKIHASSSQISSTLTWIMSIISPGTTERNSSPAASQIVPIAQRSPCANSRTSVASHRNTDLIQASGSSRKHRERDRCKRASLMSEAGGQIRCAMLSLSKNQSL